LENAVLARRLAETDAAAIIKLGRHAARVRRLLATLGLADKAVYVERASLASERVLPLADMAEDSPYFSMILVHRRGEAWR
jgi:precorrin-2/cobalt-factor-2 C20-methyltransferase